MRGLLLFLASLLLVCNVTAFLFFPRGDTAVNCKWSSYGLWSDCDGCTKTQTRSRKIEVYAQFGGIVCSGSPYETRACVPTRGCPIEDGCGGRFRCSSGQCISKALVCNGDHDCEEDSSDEANCEVRQKVCDTDKYAPNTELTGTGYDIVTQTRKTSSVIHTKSFGGKCRKVYSGDNREYFRLSENVLTYTFKVEAKNDFTYDFYNSSWSYLKTTESHTTSNYGRKEDHSSQFSLTKEKSYQYLVLRNYVEVAQFINTNPEFLTLAEPFWKELFNLPSVYEYSAYRKLIDNYGTHFLQSGSLGGEYEFRFYMETEKMTQNGVTMSDVSKCTSSKGGFLIFSYSSSECKRTVEMIKSSSGSNDQEIRGHAVVTGGEAKFVTALSYFSLNKPAENQKRYAAWAGSVTGLPTVIRFQLTPLYELVKEVPCASAKRIYLKRAIEEYIGEAHPCRCKPCQNNGQPVTKERECECYCKMNTYGKACQYGTATDESPGVVHGSWSCWSSWNICRGTSGRRVRNRVCNNPAPSGGGKSCIGDSIESQKCEEDELEHLRTVEPHCFDIQILPTEFCPSPPTLANGYILDDDHSYFVGKRVVYTCNSGYTLVGEAVAECKEDLQWHVGARECQRLMCSFPRLSSSITITPEKDSYHVGDKIKLSCQQGLDLEGPQVISCSSSLTWNPDIRDIQCTRKATPKTDETKCKPWEKVQESKCTCKMPAECGSSLNICAIDGRNSRNVALSVCKMHALECLGRKYTLTADENCKFPTTDKSCDSCQLWERCSDETSTCVCRKAGSCQDKGISICVLVNSRKQTLSECEAGILRCQGQDVEVVSTSPCDE